MKKILLLFFLLFGIFACKDDVPEPESQPFDTRNEMVGKYLVFSDSLSYFIAVTSLDSNTLWNLNYWIKLENALNIFPVTYYPAPDPQDKKLSNRIGVYDMNDSNRNRIPYVDKNGHRWLLRSESYEENGIQYNRISNDTLRLYLYMTNIKYRIEDGVPYEERYVKIEAVKVK